MEKEQVRKDLRNLSRLNKSIDVSIGIIKSREKRKEFETEHTDDATVDSLKESISKSRDIEKKYADAIEKLEPIDQIIVKEAYIVGKPYFRIGREIGFSEAGIKKRIEKIISRLANMM